MLLLRQAFLLRDWGATGVDDAHGQGGAGLYPYHHDTAWVDRDVFNPFGFTFIPFFAFTYLNATCRFFSASEGLGPGGLAPGGL